MSCIKTIRKHDEATFDLTKEIERGKGTRGRGAEGAERCGDGFDNGGFNKKAVDIF